MCCVDRLNPPWKIVIQPFPQKIDWRAELTSPASKGAPAGAANSLTSAGTVDSGEQSVAGAWQVEPGDASGQYQLKIYLNGRLATSVRFILH